MVLESKPFENVVTEYFDATDLLLKEIKQHGKGMDTEGDAAVRLRNIIDELSAPCAQADRIRLAYIEISAGIEREMERLHLLRLFPDLQGGTCSKFKLMEDIEKLYKDILISPTIIVPEFTLTGSSHEWRDKGLLAFAIDQQAYLSSTKFSHLWDAIQCYEMSRYLIAELFSCLNELGRL